MRACPRDGGLDDPVDRIDHSRALHDAVCGDLTDLLVELEVTRRRRPSPELDRQVGTVREILVEVRNLVWDLCQRAALDTIALGTATAEEDGAFRDRHGSSPDECLSEKWMTTRSDSPRPGPALGAVGNV